jgi:beta-glucuronidase
MKQAGNFQSDIHTIDYEEPLLQKKLNYQNLINLNGRRYESLNGLWNFEADWYDKSRRAKWYKDKWQDENGNELPVDWDWEGWDFMEVPACWNMRNPELKYFEGSGVFTRTFVYKPQKAEERVILCFEGVNYRCSVFVNGEHAGTHDGGSTPFTPEITGFLQDKNRIVVIADARRKFDRVPSDNTDWFNYGGIYRDIFLIRVPRIFLKNWFLRLVPNGLFNQLEWRVDLPEGTAGRVGLWIDELQIHEEMDIQNGVGRMVFPANPELWSPENPKCYNIEIKIITQDRETDRITEKIGFREIRVQQGELLLNGKPIFLKGVCVHEDHFEQGKTTNEVIIRSIIRDLKALHGNYLRLTHYPHDRRFPIIADEEGVLLWEEIPVYWVLDFTNPQTYESAENQLRELILRDQNRASVIIWSMGNENADTDERLAFMSRLAQCAHEHDPVRLVSAACLINHDKHSIDDRLVDFLDVIGINEYYGWYRPGFSDLEAVLKNINTQKPVVVCEFGAGALAGHRGTGDELFTEDKQAEVYREQLMVLSSSDAIKGLSPWILYDYRTPHRLNRYQRGFNRKGLIDADRKTKKLAFFALAEFYQKFPDKGWSEYTKTGSF